MILSASISDALFITLWDHVLGDLPTHVALAQTSKRLRTVYTLDDEIWRAACFVAGFGRPLHRSNGAGAVHGWSWRRLAHILVRHSEKCEIGSCVKANTCFAERYENLTYTRVRTLHPHHPVEFHPLYFYLHFSQNHQAPSHHRRTVSTYLPTPSPSPSPTPPASIPDAVSILLTHLPTFPECRYAQYGPLCSHPNASCVFATFPPVPRLEFENGDGEVFMVVENPGGCTVLDVNRALAQLIPLDQYHLEVAHSHYQDLALASGMSISQYANAISRERGFLGDHEYPFLQHIVANM
ncbi:hypothetical protein K466DRAFT_584647 [Polyporus arcularius HHB13444]|uniref:F-box domain-containing protein n=1 Tax=Polyporus arcularius HHB13444 TaxID=1314778 RepID=A0A5C3PKG7_9APHY|nr:hypothetical protein K466DRAFT_584647 [Polyporus arcularius HHB13444]